MKYTPDETRECWWAFSISIMLFHLYQVMTLQAKHIRYSEIYFLYSYLRPYYNTCFVTPVFCFFLAFSLPFFIISHVFTCVFETASEMREKREKITQSENIFLYYTMRWVKTRAGHVFGMFEVTKTQTQRIV